MSRDIIPDLTTTDPATASTVAVLPVGAFEQHGPHLPLGTDTLIACAITTAISDHHSVLPLPPVTFGCSHEHAAFPGTISISATTLTAIIADIGQSSPRTAHGADRGQRPRRQRRIDQCCAASQPARRSAAGRALSAVKTGPRRAAAAITTSSHDDMHAGELETSILLAAHPDYLRDGWPDDDHTAVDRRYLTTLGITAYTTTGVIGYPSRASQAKGRTALDHLGRNAAALIDILTGPDRP